MKYLITLLSIVLFQGCLYFNDRGVSGHLYDNCHSYYDGEGNFIQECDGNIIDYYEVKEGVIALTDEIAESLSITATAENSNSGINIEDLTAEEQHDLIKEEFELIPSHCK